jgi:hypothetical protein
MPQRIKSGLSQREADVNLQGILINSEYRQSHIHAWKRYQLLVTGLFESETTVAP